MDQHYRNIIFDLDGTLVRTEDGLFDSITYALEMMGVRPGDRKDMKRMIGPVLHESFQKFYDMSAEEADRANALFFEAYDKEGICNASVYDGVEEMLEELRKAGMTLLVVTAKPRDMAETVLHHTGIDRFFQTVIGPGRSDKKTDKGSLLRDALCWLADSAQYPFQKDKTIVVGDRLFDIEAAGGAGLSSIGVLYGYGDKEELTTAGAAYLAGTPADVVKIICGQPL